MLHLVWSRRDADIMKVLRSKWSNVVLLSWDCASSSNGQYAAEHGLDLRVQQISTIFLLSLFQPRQGRSTVPASMLVPSRDASESEIQRQAIDVQFASHVCTVRKTAKRSIAGKSNPLSRSCCPQALRNL